MLSHGLSLNQRTEKQTPNRSNQSPMKKILLLLTCVFTFLLATAEVNYRRPQYRKLPAAAQAFLYQNFPHHRVLDVDYEDNGRYEVELSGDIEIKFNHNGRWIKMESGRRGIPYSALPSIVERRVSERYRYPVRVVASVRPSGRTPAGTMAGSIRFFSEARAESSSAVSDRISSTASL